jgi:hypothetical protein
MKSEELFAFNIVRDRLKTQGAGQAKSDAILVDTDGLDRLDLDLFRGKAESIDKQYGDEQDNAQRKKQ